MSTRFCSRLKSYLLNQRIFSQLVGNNFFEVNTQREMHSQITTHDFENMVITVLPALQDNYMYLITDKSSMETAVVDPVYPDLVINTVTKNNFNLTTILTTHHHSDHAGGNAELISKVKDIRLEVLGGDIRIDTITHFLKTDEKYRLGTTVINCIRTPCHTQGHFCYAAYDALLNKPALFTGDTLFIGGCGRFFEGTAKEMNHALEKLVRLLPSNTKVFCGHEYTINNLKFGLTVEKDNQYIKKKLEEVTELRKKKYPTVPSTIRDEKNINPFLRVKEKSVQSYASSDDPVETMAFLRKQKDAFKP